MSMITLADDQTPITKSNSNINNNRNNFSNHKSNNKNNSNNCNINNISFAQNYSTTFFATRICFTNLQS